MCMHLSPDAFDAWLTSEGIELSRPSVMLLGRMSSELVDPKQLERVHQLVMERFPDADVESELLYL